METMTHTAMLAATGKILREVRYEVLREVRGLRTRIERVEERAAGKPRLRRLGGIRDLPEEDR